MTPIQTPGTGKFVARECDLARDRPVLEAWFVRMVNEWRDRSAFTESCCPEEREGEFLTFDGYMRTLFALFMVERDGIPVAMGGLGPLAGQPGVAYARGYSVEPELQGSAIGSLLYPILIKKLIDRGYQRMVMRTAADNAEGIAIYKASGSFWVPGTDGWWENYLPLLWRHPQTVAFCEQHNLDLEGWLRCYLKTALATRPEALRHRGPDEYTYGDTLVFPYTWRADHDELVFRIGVERREIISVTRSGLTVNCFLEPQTTTLYCAVENLTEHPRRCTLTFLKGAEHSTWQSRLRGAGAALETVATPGVLLVRRFHLRPTAETRHTLATVVRVEDALFPFFCTFENRPPGDGKPHPSASP